MLDAYNLWELSNAEKQKYEDWMTRILTGHTGTKDVRNERINWFPLTKPLSECTVGLFTTGGVHLITDKPFDVADAHGDPSFREMPNDADVSDLTITHTHYSHVAADRDINCIFPIERLRELKAEGVIGDIAPRSYNIMGFNPDPTHLIEQTAPELAKRYKTDGVDVLFMTCG